MHVCSWWSSSVTLTKQLLLMCWSLCVKQYSGSTRSERSSSRKCWKFFMPLKLSSEFTVFYWLRMNVMCLCAQVNIKVQHVLDDQNDLTLGFMPGDYKHLHSSLFAFCLHKHILSHVPYNHHSIMQCLCDGCKHCVCICRIYRGALWILGEYCSTKEDIQSVMTEVRRSLGEVKFLVHNHERNWAFILHISHNCHRTVYTPASPGYTLCTVHIMCVSLCRSP